MMTFNSKLPIKKSKEQINFYLENGPKFGQILRELYSEIKNKILETDIAIRYAFEDRCKKVFDLKMLSPSDFYNSYPFMRQTNTFGDSFDSSICISVNDCVAHGKCDFNKGDIVSVDCGLSLQYSEAPIRVLNFDGAFTVIAGEKDQKWVTSPLEALKNIIEEQPKDTYELGGIIEDTSFTNNLANIVALTGHGIGSSLHEAPVIHNGRGKYIVEELFEGICFCAEPMFVESKKNKITERICLSNDGWSIHTQSGDPVSHFETMFCRTDGQLVDILNMTKWDM